jgi:hypothetical protein
VISVSVRIGTGLSGELAISIPSVGAFSRSPSVTSQRQNLRIPRRRVLMVAGSHVSASSASQAAMACRVSSSSTGSRPRSVSQRLKYRTLWLYSSMVRGGPQMPPQGRQQVPADYSSPPAGFLARLGWTRIGSPGISGERTTKALFNAEKPQVAEDRGSGGYRASLPAPGQQPTRKP